MKVLHIPVMAQEVVDILRAEQGGAFLDCTLGGGGHTQALLMAHPDNQVVAIDRDAEAISRCEALQQQAAGRLVLHHAAFSNLLEVIPPASFNGMLADLGLCTDQLAAQRGFSFNDTGPLDMRMDRRSDVTAEELVNGLSARDLMRLLRRGGVGREALGIAHAIVRARPIKDAQMLADAVARVFRGRKTHLHPATLTFQALRMAVNRELEELESLLDAAPQILRPGGRLAVIGFQSLEDKAVTQRMRAWQRGEEGGSGPQQGLGRLLTRHALRPLPAEVECNAAARSARLRAFEFMGG